MKVSIGAATDIGQVREGNEDSFLVVAPLYAVADGMGGHRGGEVASSLALETVQGMFERREGSLADQVVEANRAVFDRSQNDRSVSGMGTTLTAALKPLERRRLVKVSVDAEDKRSRRLAITAAGRALLARAFPLWMQTHADIERLIPGGSADDLRAGLQALS